MNKIKYREKPFRKKLRRWIFSENNWPPESIEEQEFDLEELQEVRIVKKLFED